MGVLKPRCEKDPIEDPHRFREALATWFGKEGRDYPWRRTRDPYAVLVSEVMLQQTQIATVLGRGFYTRFLERFPDPASLASADDDSLLKAWEGLGYYRRARMLREAARAVETKHGGAFPRSHDEVLALPGVGRYTAGAVLSFAFDEPAALVDGNVARVFSRLLDCHEPVDTGPTGKKLWRWAEHLLDRERPRVFNSALMELGQTRCRPGVPDCLACPVSGFCRTRSPEELPKKGKRMRIEEIEEHVVVAVKGGRILLRQLGEGRRAGMWRLPERSESELGGCPVVHRRKYGITRYRVTLLVHRSGRVAKQAGESWRGLAELDEIVMPPADRAALTAVLGDREEIA